VIVYLLDARGNVTRLDDDDLTSRRRPVSVLVGALFRYL
jgi:hypothetical protein